MYDSIADAGNRNTPLFIIRNIKNSIAAMTIGTTIQVGMQPEKVILQIIQKIFQLG